MWAVAGRRGVQAAGAGVSVVGEEAAVGWLTRWLATKAPASAKRGGRRQQQNQRQKQKQGQGAGKAPISNAAQKDGNSGSGSSRSKRGEGRGRSASPPPSSAAAGSQVKSAGSQKAKAGQERSRSGTPKHAKAKEVESTSKKQPEAIEASASPAASPPGISTEAWGRFASAAAAALPRFNWFGKGRSEQQQQQQVQAEQPEQPSPSSKEQQHGRQQQDEHAQPERAAAATALDDLAQSTGEAPGPATIVTPREATGGDAASAAGRVDEVDDVKPDTDDDAPGARPVEDSGDRGFSPYGYYQPPLPPPQTDLVDLYLGEGNMSAPERFQVLKQQVMQQYARHSTDCGSSEVQVAVLTQRIARMTTHLRSNRQDKHSKRGLDGMLNQRRKHLQYLRRTDPNRYGKLIFSLNLKDRA
eukprot:jgi/Chlat1/4021/Chrsp26S03994